MDKIVIYGAGNFGKSAYHAFKTTYECLFFIDGDPNKWFSKVEDLVVMPPSTLSEIKECDITIVIACAAYKEILESLQEKKLKQKIWVYELKLSPYLQENRREELNGRTIDLGAFLQEQKEINCKELAFVPGGSTLLDYCFLKCLASKYDIKKYLEIGTYIGESINILTDDCDVLYSITAPAEAPYGMDLWCRCHNLPCYSDRLTYNKKIKHFYTNSQTFDFSQIADEDIDLFFIDGDHSYNGVYSDTKHIFEIKSEKAIVVWHDFRFQDLSYRGEVVNAVADVLGGQFSNVYVTDRNLCGIYIPPVYANDFKLHELQYEVNTALYTYDVQINNIQAK